MFDNNGMFDECKIEGDFVLSSGRKSQYFYDFDLLLPRETATYSEYMVQAVPRDLKKSINFIATPATGGIIPGFLMAFAMAKPLVIVEKDGTLRGPKYDGGNYLIVDDVISSFREVNRVRSLLPKSKCVGVSAYIFRGAMSDLTRQDFPCFYLSRKEIEE